MNRSQRRAEKQRGRAGGRALPPASAAVFAAALQHHQAGAWQEAEQHYRQVLAADPRHADTLHLLGVLALQAGQPGAAVELIGKAIAIDPEAALYYCNSGNALRAAGRLDDAILHYRRAISLKPDYAEAINNLGAALQAQGLAGEAAACFRRAIGLQPDLLEAHDNLGNALAALGRPEDAVACHRRAAQLSPAYSPAHNNLGAALRQLGRQDEAAEAFHRALALQPDFAEAHANLGALLKQQGQADAAIASCRKAIALHPSLAEAHEALGGALADNGLLAEAAASLQQAIALQPGNHTSHDNLATVLLQQGYLDDAIAGFRTAVALQPQAANAHHNLAMALLARGDMAEGWREYEWRWRMPHSPQRPFAQPQWRGEPGGGRTLLIHAEQGFGDTIQFCRYASLAAAAQWRVVLEVQRPLVRLLRSLAGVEQIIPQGEALPAFDAHCPMLSLPLALAGLPAIPSAHSYLSHDPAEAAAWRPRLGAAPLIGLAWAGSASLATDRRRSLAPQRFAPLLAVPGLQFVSLQKDGPRPPAEFALTDVMAEIEDFAATAALIANLDLIIAVDTAVAHLAAALSRPVWLLDRFDSDWRWQVDRKHSPWYPTLRRYRQDQPGNWDSVLAEVAADLRAARWTSG